MATKTFRMSFPRRLGNLVVYLLLTLGIPPDRHMYLMSVRGRKSGKVHSTPLTLVERNQQRFLVAPYGEVDWVRNVRVAGEVTLSRGRRSETVKVAELNPTDSAPVLRDYLRQVSIVRPYFEATPDSPLSVFAEEAPRHPVFRVVSTSG
ncbi:MAG: nitroreductase family deazaflavin-dependent oxidoreductase [Rubrobacter sp.]|nr:nitroreductase family deazaflavin-dependent oxidoreductase [Rubrobacter sp.]